MKKCQFSTEEIQDEAVKPRNLRHEFRAATPYALVCVALVGCVLIYEGCDGEQGGASTKESQKAKAERERERLRQEKEETARQRKKQALRLKQCQEKLDVARSRAKAIPVGAIRVSMVSKLNEMEAKCLDYANARIAIPEFDTLVTNATAQAEWEALTPAQRKAVTAKKEEEKRREEMKREKEEKEKARRIHRELMELHATSMGQMDQWRRSEDPYVVRRCIEVIQKKRPVVMQLRDETRDLPDEHHLLKMAASFMLDCMSCVAETAPRGCSRALEELQKAKRAL